MSSFDKSGLQPEETVNPRLFGLQWHVTNECDQRCKHCYVWQKNDKRGIGVTPRVSDCQRIIDDFLDFCGLVDARPFISVTGGDPLLYKHIWFLLELFKEKAIPFSILGNPFHLTFDYARRLKELGCQSYQMSIDGLKETHDGLRKKGSFDATWSVISTVNRAGLRSMIMSTVSLLNYRDTPEVARLCVDHNVRVYAFARYCPTRGDSTHNIPPAVYRDFLERMWSVYESLADRGTFFSLKDHLWTAFLHEKGLIELHEDKELILAGCNCALRHMTLLPDGKVMACRRFDNSVGNINASSFEEIFFSSEMEEFRQIHNLEGCNTCDLIQYCRGCHAVAAGSTGNFFDKDPQCWRC